MSFSEGFASKSTAVTSSPVIQIPSRAERQRSLSKRHRKNKKSSKQREDVSRSSKKKTKSKAKSRTSGSAPNWDDAQMEFIQQAIRQELKKKEFNEAGESAPSQEDINISLDSADDYVFRIKQFEKYGIRSVLDRQDHSNARRVEMEYWRMKHALEQREMENNCSTVISVGADLIETFFKGIKFTLIETEGLASVVKKALEDGKFHSSIRYYVQTTSDRSALTNPSVSFLTTFASIIFFNHIQKKNEKSLKSRKKKQSSSESRHWGNYSARPPAWRGRRSDHDNRENMEPFPTGKKDLRRRRPSQPPRAYRNMSQASLVPGRPLAFEPIHSQRESFVSYSDQVTKQDRKLGVFRETEEGKELRTIDSTDSDDEKDHSSNLMTTVIPIASKLGERGMQKKQFQKQMKELNDSIEARQGLPKIEEIF